MKIGVISLSFLLMSLMLVPNRVSGSNISVQAGIVSYPDPRTNPDVYVEFPFAVHRNQFQFLPESHEGGGLYAGIYADVVLYDQNGGVADSTSTYFLTRANDSTGAANSNIILFNRLTMMVSPGNYSGRLTVMDAVSKKEGSFLYDRLEIDSVNTRDLNLSALEFAHLIRDIDTAGNSGNRLIKNGTQVIPNPMGIYSEKDSTLYIYAELYNLDYRGNPEDDFSVHYQILDGNGAIYQDYGETFKNMPGSTSVIRNVLNITGIKAGRYVLRLMARDNNSGAEDTAMARFVVFTSGGDIQEGNLVIYNVINPYDTASGETKYELVKYLLAPQQMATYKTLNEGGKGRFIDQFLADRDPDPSTSENEFIDDLFSRYIYANEHFSTLPGLSDGWKTDRGRIIMQYGRWDEREEANAPAYGKPWEIWHYYALQGGVIFVFQDVDGYGDYELVHSTAKGEKYDSDWDEVLEDLNPATLR
nr:GWxTD domain-containing protein [candidate division Zixibacteria bacterium]